MISIHYCHQNQEQWAKAAKLHNSSHVVLQKQVLD